MEASSKQPLLSDVSLGCSPVGLCLNADDQIADLERKIAFRTAGRIRELRVESSGEMLILCGRTTTYYVKQLATQIALDEQFDLSLQNSIEVI
ncbi:hypothetical protein [Planctomicrobium sp. SH664]|uniref:hypothetical protein n=1 Tax=Planctomicrobium sp. SH664 TaxID=3448125 RepID=UPI003F5C8923